MCVCVYVYICVCVYVSFLTLSWLVLHKVTWTLLLCLCCSYISWQHCAAEIFHDNTVLLKYFITTLCCSNISWQHCAAQIFHNNTVLLKYFMTTLCYSNISWQHCAAQIFHNNTVLLKYFMTTLCCMCDWGLLGCSIKMCMHWSMDGKDMGSPHGISRGNYEWWHKGAVKKCACT